MSIVGLLENFDRPEPDFPDGQATRQTGEDAQSESYESGYKAGWDDSLAAQATESDRLTGDLARNLQDLSFTYHEARSGILSLLTPLLLRLSEGVLPELARATLAPRLAELLNANAERIAGLPVELVIAPDDESRIAPVLDDEFGFPLTLVPDQTLLSGQVLLRFAQSEQQIDEAELVETLRDAITAFLDNPEKDVVNG